MNCNINENDVFNVTIIENDNIQCSLEDEKNVNSSVIARGPRGAKGDPGEPGRDGISPEAEVTRETGKAVLTVTDARGTTTADIYDGQNGADGADGEDGFSPSASVVKSGDTATITITDKDGTTTASITDGQDGADGEPGEAATIEIGTVTTVNYDQPATVTNVGTDKEAKFDFEIPRGVPGSSGGYEAGTAIDTTDDVISVKYDNNTLKVNSSNQLYAVNAGNVDDVKVNGTSVVTNKVANVSATAIKRKRYS